MLKISCRLWFSALIGTGALVGGEANVLASPIQATIGYSTTGSFGAPGPSSTLTQAVTFQGVSDGSFVTGAPFALGTFQVNPSMTGEVNVPFTITYKANTVDGTVPAVNQTPVVLQGRLVGALGAGSQTFLWAEFDQGPQFADPKYYNPRPAPPFQTGGLTNTISVNNGLEILPLTLTGAGTTTVEGQIDIVPVPEPTTLAVFCVVGLGLLSRQCLARLYRRRHAAGDRKRVTCI